MADKPSWKALLRLYAADLQSEYNMLLYGKSPYDPFVVDTHFGDVTGTVFQGRQHADLFFGVNGRCYRCAPRGLRAVAAVVAAAVAWPD